MATKSMSATGDSCCVSARAETRKPSFCAWAQKLPSTALTVAWGQKLAFPDASRFSSYCLI